MDDENPIIDSQYIRDEYQWDRMSDVKWDIVRNNYEAADRVLSNPSKFPKADFEAVQRRADELFLFLSLNFK